MSIIIPLAAALAACFVSWLLLPLMRTLAFRLGAVDHPGPRRMHHQVTPRLGGLAVFAGVCAGISVGAMVAVREAGALGLAWCDGLFSVIIAVGACFMVLGFVDDVRALPASVKLGTEVLLALVLFGVGGQISAIEIPAFGVIHLGWFASMFVTVLWVTAVTNAFNMIDGINGLAGGVGLTTAGAIMVIAYSTGATGALLLAAVLAGSMVSFLRANLRPGGIFLGDSGSLFVGFLLSAATLQLAQSTGQTLFPAIGLLLLGLPLIEVITTVVRRTLASRSWRRGLRGLIRFARTELMRPDTGHLHHILIRGGMPAGSTAMLLVGAAALCAGCSVAMFLLPAYSTTFLISGGVVALGGGVLSLRGWRPDQVLTGSPLHPSITDEIWLREPIDILAASNPSTPLTATGLEVIPFSAAAIMEEPVAVEDGPTSLAA